MRDLDWLNAMYLGAYGFALGPLLGFAAYRLSQLLSPGPFGELIDPVAAVLAGTLAGSVLGFLWGLLGEQLRDALYDVSMFLQKRFRKLAKRPTAESEDEGETEAVQSAEPDRHRIVESQMKNLGTIPLAGDEEGVSSEETSPPAAEHFAPANELQQPVLDAVPNEGKAVSSGDKSLQIVPVRESVTSRPLPPE